MKLKPIAQQVVVLMGASSGIGRLAALAFARRGARVVVSARSNEGLESLVQEIRSRGGQAIAVPADVRDLEQVQRVANEAVAAFGGIDTWVQLAAVAVYAQALQTTPDEFRQVIDVNLLGQVHGAMAAIPHMRRQGGGSLILISSVEAERALPYHSAYAAAKHGVRGFADSLRLELRHNQVPVSVTNIMPASINTPFFDKARTKLGVRPKGMPPIYEPEEVVEAILDAAEHPTREQIVGGAGKVMVWGQRLLPGLMDAYLLRTAFSGQRTRETKTVDAPNNLFEPIPEHNRIYGDPQRHRQQVQAQQQPSEPGWKWALSAMAVGAVAAFASQRRTQQQPDRRLAYRTQRM
jgi:NAD(P)-dependent dehydrogenase (short-subunit alcohol dehydrogenase family)